MSRVTWLENPRPQYTFPEGSMSRLRHFSVAATLLIVVACGTESTNTIPENGGAIRFNLHEISAQSSDCAESEDRCARVTLKTMETTGGGTVCRDDQDERQSN